MRHAYSTLASSERLASIDVCNSDYVATSTLAALRLTMAAIIWSCITFAVNSGPITLKLQYMPQSKLMSMHDGKTQVDLVGLKRQSPFTGQSFILLGLYFTLAGCASALGACDGRMRVLLACLFSTIYPVHLLISAIVTYILIPMGLRRAPDGKLTVALGMHTALIAHNANMAFVSIELALSRQQVLAELFPFAILWGVYFVLFSWYWARKHRLFYYLFIDATLPPALSVSMHVGLVGTLALFTQVGAFISTATKAHGLLAEAGASCLIVFGVTRINFHTSKWRIW